jgi:hypothetical protein
MTLQDIIDLLLAGDSTEIPRDVAITRAVLLAYELGLEQGRKEAPQTPWRRTDACPETAAAARST